MGTFEAQVSAWAKATKERHRAIFRDAAQRVVALMQAPVGEGGRIPIVTGFLRSSLQASLTAMPPMREGAVPKEGVTYPYSGAEVALVINSAEVGDTIYVGYAAAYARRLEYGFKGEDSLGRVYDQSGRGWVRAAAEQWPQVVKQAETEAYAAVAARQP
jgi:hypothetical protein